MKQHIKREVVLQSMEFFSRTPGPSDHAADVIADHRAGMVEGKERVVPSLLEFPHSHHAGPPAFVWLMSSLGKKSLYGLGITVAAI